MVATAYTSDYIETYGSDAACGKAPSRLCRQIFVGGLPTNVTQAALRAWAQRTFAGRVINAVLVVDKRTHKRPRGFGFVTFDSADAATLAVRFHHYDFEGKQVEVKRAETVQDLSSSQGRRSPHSAAYPPSPALEPSSLPSSFHTHHHSSRLPSYPTTCDLFANHAPYPDTAPALPSSSLPDPADAPAALAHALLRAVPALPLPAMPFPVLLPDPAALLPRHASAAPRPPPLSPWVWAGAEAGKEEAESPAGWLLDLHSIVRLAIE